MYNRKFEALNSFINPTFGIVNSQDGIINMDIIE